MSDVDKVLHYIDIWQIIDIVLALIYIVEYASLKNTI
jgi:hypothetical protein